MSEEVLHVSVTGPWHRRWQYVITGEHSFYASAFRYHSAESAQRAGDADAAGFQVGPPARFQPGDSSRRT